ncbi:putative G/T mismatch-specific thymine DNA glycosylase [Hypsibius exemplaris]|uniref:G/T mismatch-specific thymine DNA glycosylase n=1 Tax=Hypsibius exemplaris TaxID=2072580 RepID=A0A1W0XBF3_HYPEX|nr:putative G/T mismatch-specific thymine DNA glycosylase [Hypsibius exemplaris]
MEKDLLNLSKFAFRPNTGRKRNLSPSKDGTSETLLLNKTPNADLSTKQRPTDNVNRKKKSKRMMDDISDVRLPDYFKHGLDILFVGFNPGFNSASNKHHYAGPGNHFWKCLHLSGLVPEALTFHDDIRILDFNIGLTNIVSRPSQSSSDLSKTELKEGAVELRRKILQYRPRIVVFNGLGIYEAFTGGKEFSLGKQPEPLSGAPDVQLYVMPSSSPRGTKWPRLQDKLKFYQGIAHLRDFLLGKVTALQVEKVVFAK